MSLIYTNAKHKPKRKPKKQVPKAGKYKRPFKERQVPAVQQYRAAGTEGIKSKLDEFLAETEPKQVIPQRYEGDMADREAAAQEEIKRKAQCVAPAFNKGPYTYIATEEQAKWVGRK